MKKILIIDDNKIYHDALGDLLKEDGYEVISAFDGIEGYKKFESENPDLIVLDIIMTGENGFFVLEKLKDKKIPIIVSSNYVGAWDLVKDFRVTDFILKADTSSEVILKKINEILK